MTRIFERILQKRKLSCIQWYCPGSTDLCCVDCRSDALKFPFLCSVCVLIHVCVFDSCFLRLWKFFVTFGIATSFEQNLQLFPIELAIYYARLSGSFVFFTVNHLSENKSTAKIRNFCHQYSSSTNFYGFYLIGHQPSHAWVILEM